MAEEKQVRTLEACWESEVKGIKCLESNRQYGFRKDGNDIRPSQCVWIDKDDFDKLYQIIIFKEQYNNQFN